MVARGTDKIERIALRVQMMAHVDSINQDRKYRNTKRFWSGDNTFFYFAALIFKIGFEGLYFLFLTFY